MTRPRLTLDVHPLFDLRWTGIPIFTRRLVEALLREGSLELAFCKGRERVPTPAVVAALRAASGAVLHEAVQWEARGKGSTGKRPAQLLFPSVKKFRGLGAREASTVHDLSTLLMPENHEDGNVVHHLEHFREELRSNEVVFCVSEATRAALTTVLPSVSAKTRVLYQYTEWPEEFAELERNSPPLRMGRYAVVIGTLEPRKNLSLILKALATRSVARSGLNFIVVGKQGWLTGQLLEGLTPAQRKRIQFTGFASEFTKYRLIRNAEFLVYPSLYEGFGIPALEAMSLGKPVLAARTSSFPEIIEDAGVYFDPLSVDEFVSAMQEIQNPKRLQELGPRALQQHAKFTWQRMAAPVVEWAKG